MGGRSGFSFRTVLHVQAHSQTFTPRLLDAGPPDSPSLPITTYRTQLVSCPLTLSLSSLTSLTGICSSRTNKMACNGRIGANGQNACSFPHKALPLTHGAADMARLVSTGRFLPKAPKQCTLLRTEAPSQPRQPAELLINPHPCDPPSRLWTL